MNDAQRALAAHRSRLRQWRTARLAIALAVIFTSSTLATVADQYRVTPFLWIPVVAALIVAMTRVFDHVNRRPPAVPTERVYVVTGVVMVSARGRQAIADAVREERGL